jgi:hypothetical protein
MLTARLGAKMESLSPFLWDSFIPNYMPVDPGALPITPLQKQYKGRSAADAKDNPAWPILLKNCPA